MRLKLAGLALAVATLVAAPAVAQSDDLTLLCTMRDGPHDLFGARVAHIDINFANQLITVSGDDQKYQTGLSSPYYDFFAITSQTLISFGKKSRQDGRVIDSFEIDRTTGVLTEPGPSGVAWVTADCVRETVATKF